MKLLSPAMTERIAELEAAIEARRLAEELLMLAKVSKLSRNLEERKLVWAKLGGFCVDRAAQLRTVNATKSHVARKPRVPKVAATGQPITTEEVEAKAS